MERWGMSGLMSFANGKGGAEMTEEQMRQRREELRKIREHRRRLQKLQRRRRIRQILLSVFLLTLAVGCTVFFARFPTYFKRWTHQDEIESVAVATKPTSVPTPVVEVTPEPEKKAVSKQAFSQFAGYVEQNEGRYQNYKKTSGFSDGEVVWRVNARLDLEEYQDFITISTKRLNTNPLVIVNKYHKVPEGYEPPDLKPNVDGCYLRAEAADAFDRMKRDAATQGLNLRAISGYRSVGYQRDLYNSYLEGDSRENVDTYSARAGHSEHHTGLAVDVFGSVDGLGEFENTPEYVWVKKYGSEYGFIIRYTTRWESVTGYMDEPWHLRYIGREYAMDMKEKNIETLEEYVGMNGTLE